MLQVSCPGVWLSSRGTTYLSICILGHHIQTREAAPVFPLMFHEKFIIEKVSKINWYNEHYTYNVFLWSASICICCFRLLVTWTFCAAPGLTRVIDLSTSKHISHILCWQTFPAPSLPLSPLPPCLSSPLPLFVPSPLSPCVPVPGVWPAGVRPRVPAGRAGRHPGQRGGLHGAGAAGASAAGHGAGLVRDVGARVPLPQHHHYAAVLGSRPGPAHGAHRTLPGQSDSQRAVRTQANRQ